MAIKANNKVVVLLVALVVIFCSGHAFQTIFTFHTKIILVAGVIALLLELLRVKDMKLGKSQIALTLFALMVIVTFIAYRGQGSTFYFRLACFILAGFGLAQMYSFKQIARCHVTLMTVVTMVALVGYALVQNTTILKALPKYTNLNDVEYRVAVIFNYIPEVADRNCGMFWEPGLFATHLIIATVFEIMFSKKPSIWRLAIFSAGIVTANSAAGFALLLLCLMLLFVKRVNLSKNLLSTIIGVIALILGIAVILNFDALLAQTGLGNNQYMSKLSSDSVMDSSRMSAIEHNVEQFFASPIFGIGFSAAFANSRHVSDTSTSTYLLSVFGILGALYTAYWAYGIFKQPKVNILAKILLFVIALVILNKEPHFENLMTWCILFALIRGDYSDIDVEEKKKQRIVFRWR